MRRINPDHIRTADYAVFDEPPPMPEKDNLVHSYAMEHDGRYARLDVRSDDRGRFEIMGSLVPDDPVEIGIVTWIPIVTVRGKSEAFERFCEQGPASVLATEPRTLLWFSLKDKTVPGRFAIIDLYPDRSGLLAHNEGEVAATLKHNAPELVAGGWKAVVSGAIVYRVAS